MLLNEFLNDNGFADARAAKQTDFAAAQVRLEQIDHLDAGLEHFESGGLFGEVRGRAMNG